MFVICHILQIAKPWSGRTHLARDFIFCLELGRLAEIRTILGPFKIRLLFILTMWAKINTQFLLKSPIFVPFGANLVQLEAKRDYLGFSQRELVWHRRGQTLIFLRSVYFSVHFGSANKMERNLICKKSKVCPINWG